MDDWPIDLTAGGRRSTSCLPSASRSRTYVGAGADGRCGNRKAAVSLIRTDRTDEVRFLFLLWVFRRVTSDLGANASVPSVLRGVVADVVTRRRCSSTWLLRQTRSTDSRRCCDSSVELAGNPYDAKGFRILTPRRENGVIEPGLQCVRFDVARQPRACFRY